MFDTKHSSSGHVLALVAGLVAVVCAGLLLLNRQAVIDQITVWQYRPSSEIAVFAERAGLSDTGKFYYYASRPSLDSAQNFNKQCNRIEDSTAILGCYTLQRIYLYNVENKQLDGIREVTAAHEMLHAAYERLGASEKDKVDGLVEAEYSKLKDNKSFADRMSFYERTEPGQRANELHSIIATEVADISPELESYYTKYFADRSKVVSLYTSYAAVFATLQARSEVLSSQMATLADEIEKTSTEYNAGVQQLNQDITSFNSRAESGAFTSQSTFNTQRVELVARAATLDAQRQTINDNIATYATLREELLKISSQSEELNRSIDSKLAPVPSL